MNRSAAMKTLLAVTSLIVLLAPSLWSGPKMTITDKEGRSLEAELLAVRDDSIRFKSLANSKEYTLPFSKLSAETIKAAKNRADEIPILYPELDISVVIGKKQKRLGNSSYMKSMDVKTTVKVKNTDNNAPCPPTKGHVLFFGQNQATPDVFTVLTTRNFEFSLNGGETKELPLQGFRTEFDSDNKGYNNVGGYKYVSYLLVLTDHKGHIIDHKTTSSKVSKNIENTPDALQRYLRLSADTKLNDDLDP